MSTYNPPDCGSIVPSSASVRAPRENEEPENTQIAITNPGSGTRWAMSAGTTKMPDPMTAPTSSAAP